MCAARPNPSVRRMTTIRTHNNCSVPADRVLLAARDFSARRPDVFPAVRAEHLTVHSRGANHADVTEGTPAGIGVNWERCFYDWSDGGRVVATVTDSNVYAMPGSSWQITATPADEGSVVEMVWVRRFRRTPRGLFWSTLFALVGRPIFRSYARQVVKNIERLEQSAAHVAPRGA